MGKIAVHSAYEMFSWYKYLIGKIAANSAYEMFLWYKYLIVSLFFSHLGFWSGSLFLIAPLPDLCLLVLFLSLFAITAAGVCGPEKSPRTSSIVQIKFSFSPLKSAGIFLEIRRLLSV